MYLKTFFYECSILGICFFNVLTLLLELCYFLSELFMAANS